MTILQRKESAMEYFTKGYNCSQSVVLAFADLLPYDEKTLARLSSSFGGGIARMREVCGSISGMAIVAGFLYGYDAPIATDEKTAHYTRIQEMAKEFESKNGSIVCRDLLALSQKHDEPKPEARTREYYEKRPCRELVGISAEILATYIENHPM